MKAMIATKYGPPEVLKLQEVAKPVPADNEVLVRIYATAVTAGDSRVRGFIVPLSFWIPARLTLGLTKPKKAIQGMVLAGEVESVGKDVTRFKPGDQVHAYDITKLSTYAEYASVPETSALVHKPASLTFEEAAALSFGGVTALDFLRRAHIHSGQRVLIYGASGSVGTAAVQLAKHFGAHVTGVCSTANVPLVRSLGADRIIDYTKEDFTQNGETYDIIFDTVGKSSLYGSLRSLTPGGAYLQAAAGPSELLRMWWASRRSGMTMISGTAYPTAEALTYLNDLAEAGEFRPVIDREWPLEQLVEAHRYVDQGHKKGNVIITVGHSATA
ncbi:MAG: NAD(P)-dependent alcohol dehydrogenase [Anaerolineae bacterium]